MSTLLKKLKELRTLVSKRTCVSKPTVFWNKKLSGSQITKIQNAAPFEIPPEVLNVYRQVNGLVIDWESPEPEQPWRTTHGVCNVPRLDFLFRHEQITTSTKGKSALDHYWPDDASEDEVEHFKSFYVLDDLRNGEFVLVRPGDEHCELHLYTSPATFQKLDLDVESYVLALVEAEARYGWQHAHLETPRSAPPEVQVGSTTHYHARLHEQVAKLKANPHTKKLKFTPNPGVRASTLKRIKNQVGLALPGEMRAFYTYLNGFKLSWTWNDGSTAIEGSVDLLPLEHVFGGPGGRLTKTWGESFIDEPKWHDDASKEIASKARAPSSFRVESVQGASREVCARFDLAEDGPSPIMVFVDKGDARILNVKFGAYIERLIQTLGLRNWHRSLERDESEIAHAMRLIGL